MKYSNYKMKYVSSIVILLFVSMAHATNEWHESYNSTRSLGMGGCAVALTSDDTALYRNPANLGSLREIFGTIIDPEIEGTANMTATSTEISSAISALSGKPDTYYHAKMQATPILVRRNVGFGLIYKNELSAEITSATPTAMDTNYVSDLGVAIGANLRLFDGIVKLGVTGRAINRIEVTSATLDTTGATDLATIATEGSAVATDAGLLIQLPIMYIPTLGVTVHDVGDTKFDVRDGVRMRTTNRPNTVKQSTDVAISFFPIHANNLRSLITFEATDVGNSRNDIDSAKRVHFGYELNVRDLFFFRAGLNQRYWTAGFELSSEYFMWQISSYGEEIGTQAAPREDRRLNMKFSLRF